MKIKQFLLGLTLVFSVTLTAALTGCASNNLAPGNYDSSEVGKINQVVPGIIISKRPVNINTPTNNPSEAPAAGAVGGPGVEYIVRLNSGSIVSIVQAEDLRLKVRQHILVVYSTNNNTHLVPDDSSN